MTYTVIDRAARPLLRADGLTAAGPHTAHLSTNNKLTARRWATRHTTSSVVVGHHAGHVHGTAFYCHGRLVAVNEPSAESDPYLAQRHRHRGFVSLPPLTLLIRDNLRADIEKALAESTP